MNKWLQLAQEVFEIEIQGLEQVKKDLDHNFDLAIEILAKCKGRVVITGIGKSGLVGRKIAATLSSTGTPAFFLHPVEGAHAIWECSKKKMLFWPFPTVEKQTNSMPSFPLFANWA